MPGGLADPTQVTWKQVSGAAVYYRQHKLAIATASSAALLRLWQHVQAGTFNESDFPDMGATTIATANTQAASLADLYLAHVLKDTPLGLTVTPDLGRLQQAVQTAASDTGTNPVDALDRLGRAEPLRTAQTSLQDGMKQREVGGWTRATSGTPCQMCADLADGSVLPPSVEMATHANCSCVQEIVT